MADSHTCGVGGQEIVCPVGTGQDAGIQFAGGLKPGEVAGLWRDVLQWDDGLSSHGQCKPEV